MMEKTWRWFGPNDPITLQMLRQIGVEGIVTSLHHLAPGEEWTREEVHKLRKYIEDAGLRWSVVESLPVSESIKYGGADREQLLETYRRSLEALGQEGVKTICYNFMPVLDWARTDLRHPNPDGTTSLYFDRGEFACFDIHILKRDGARNDYDEETLRRADEVYASLDEEGRQRLIQNIIVKTQGFVGGNISESDPDPVGKFRDLLALYKGIDRETLQANLKYFLESIMDVCDRYDMRMCIHPDDPPFPVLGLPRIMTGADDVQWLYDAVPNPHNGLTFCAGSLSASPLNDVPEMARRFAHRTWFVHLRSCQTLPGGNFKEAPHLGGRADIISLVRTFQEINPGLPMRVDHAPEMLGDEHRGYNAGYSFHGRMLALGQVTGVMAVVDREMQESKTK